MKNLRKKERFARFSSLAVGAIMLAGGTLSTILQASAADDSFSITMRYLSADEKTYGISPFNEEYSKGIVFRPESTTVNTGGTHTIEFRKSSDRILDSECPDNNNDCVTYNNTSKDNNIYIETVRGAIYNNRYLDVREYLWTDKGSWERRKAGAGVYYNASDVEGDKSGTVTRELHFYETGTNNEVEFKGVVAFADFDFAEGYTISKGYHQAYLDNPTVTVHTPGTNTWLGQGSIDNPVAFEGSVYMLWVEVEGTPSQPLTLQYKAPSSRGSGTNSPAIKVSYNLIGENPDGVSAPLFDTIAKYGTITPQNPIATDEDAVDKYTFSGWYYDEAMTRPVVETVSSGEDVELYGRYVRNEAINISTSITGGEITSPVIDADKGEDYKIEYKCNDGNLLSTVSVDGVFVDINKYSGSYTFEDVEESHKIDVVCSEGNVKVPDTGFNNISGEANTEKGDKSELNIAGLIISSAISFIGLLILFRTSGHLRIMRFKKVDF